MTVTVERKDIRGISQDGVAAAILSAVSFVQAAAADLCPVQYGQLRNSIMFKVGDEEGGFNESGGEQAPSSHKIDAKTSKTVGVVGTGSDHWYPEFGTKFQVAQPFLRPAGEIAKGSSAKSVAAKYCRDKMVQEFKQRKYMRLFGG